MKIDTGFWNKDGEYIEQIEELTMEELEEENKRLKREYDILDGIIEINNLKIAELKEENERLQEENMSMKKSFVDIIGDIREENYRYYKALEEIRCLAQSMTDDYEEMDIEQQNVYIKQVSNQIQKITSEVLYGI